MSWQDNVTFDAVFGLYCLKILSVGEITHNKKRLAAQHDENSQRIERASEWLKYDFDNPDPRLWCHNLCLPEDVFQAGLHFKSQCLDAQCYFS